jgi:hypothetical protein
MAADAVFREPGLNMIRLFGRLVIIPVAVNTGYSDSIKPQLTFGSVTITAIGGFMSTHKRETSQQMYFCYIAYQP